MLVTGSTFVLLAQALWKAWCLAIVKALSIDNHVPSLGSLSLNCNVLCNKIIILEPGFCTFTKMWIAPVVTVLQTYTLVSYG